MHSERSRQFFFYVFFVFYLGARTGHARLHGRTNGRTDGRTDGQDAYCDLLRCPHNNEVIRLRKESSTRLQLNALLPSEIMLYKSHCSHSTRSRFFAERVINVWNCLPPSVDYSIGLHLQLLGVVLTISILLRPLNATLIEFLVIL